ncbi:sugar transferase [Oribacterium sp. WCC10]|uniref:sugar transferase n=1 Tax=Oribacterium sp. WCC10 TaxID=1855343 RepID=UPI0008E754E8|nr:sugar transferase [Oribacterium sp. WCC10]SFG27182.1 exopolysaccharide biosynthesis polyprenyl glycosylphosphotransferase [Oribacterium sp. WCC10]
MIRKEKVKNSIKSIYTFISLSIAFLSAAAMWYWNVSPGWSKGFFGIRTLCTVGTLFAVVYFFFARMYDAHKIGLYRLQELAFSQMLAYGIGDSFLFVAAFFWFHNFSRIRLSFFLLGFLLQFGSILITIFIFNRLYARFDEPRKILIVYGSDDYRRLLRKMGEKRNRYDIVGIFEDSVDIRRIYDALSMCKDVYLCDVKSQIKERILLFCDAHHMDVHISADIVDLLTFNNEVSHTFDTPFLRNKKMPEAWYYGGVKRAGDIIISLSAILLLSPLFVITSLLIKLYDGGPVFYTQKRLTKDGRCFDIYKFRSMKVDSEKGGARLASVNDDRITPVGKVIRKLRIDELPQLFNILKNDMSVVGPRPERPEIAKQYEREIPEFGLRLKVKAGLTGYAQVYGKYNTTPLDKLKLDLIYISQRSVLFDLRILFYTVKIIFIPESTEGVAEDQVTALESSEGM